MSIADKITSMTNHLEKDYQALESVVGTVSVNKNIENIAPLLDNLWEELPKVTGSGTSPSISDTRAGKMKLLLSGNTSQDGTPTPDAPQTIHNVNGDNTIITTGKNQIGLKSLSSTIISGLTCSVDGDVLTINGTATAKADIQKLLFNLTANTTKTLKFYLESGTFTAGNIGIHLNENEESGQVSFIQIPYDTASLKSTKTISLTNVNYVWVYATSGSVFNNAKFKIMLSDDVNDDYEPYQISSYPLNLPVENLFNKTDYTTITTGNNDGATNVKTSNKITITTGAGANSGIYVTKANLTSYIDNYDSGTTYNVSMDIKTNRNLTISMGCDTRPSFSVSATESRINVETKISNNGLVIYSTMSNAGDTIEVTNIMISTTKGSYQLYGTTPIELNKISTYKDGFIRNSGKNLWDEVMEAGGYDLTTGEKNNSSNYRNANYIPITPNTAMKLLKPTGYYTRILFYDENKDFISAPDVIYTNQLYSAFTSPSNAYYMTFYITNSYGSTYKNDIMVYYGTTNIPYEPYGNGEWYYKQEFGEKVFTGASNEPWQDRPNYSPADRFVMDGVFPTNNRSMISNYFKINQITDDTYPYLTNNGTQCTINFSAKGTTTLAQFKTWLSTNNTKVIYPLATPTYTKITDTNLINQLEAVYRANSYKDQTNISQTNNDLPFNLDVTALEG